jgi:hypothetical protein
MAEKMWLWIEGEQEANHTAIPSMWKSEREPGARLTGTADFSK